MNWYMIEGGNWDNPIKLEATNLSDAMEEALDNCDAIVVSEDTIKLYKVWENEK